jgi:hypothetical protein
MKKNLKKIGLALLLIAVVAATAFAQKASDFTVDAKGVITAYTGKEKAVVIPATIGGKKITGIADHVGVNMGLTRVTLPEGIKTIGGWAFSTNKLTSVTIPNSVTSIGAMAFGDNPRLASVTIGKGVTSIMDYAFASPQLTSITIGANVKLWELSFCWPFPKVYDDGGKRAGTYTRPNANSSNWKRK